MPGGYKTKVKGWKRDEERKTGQNYRDYRKQERGNAGGAGGTVKEEGFDVTQATVSRDIRELKLSKVPTGDGRQKYVALGTDDSHLGDKYIRVLKEGFVSMDMAQNILVIKTVSGMAMAVAAAVDAMKFREIVGSIAGDDTIMMAVRTVEDTKVLMEK